LSLKRPVEEEQAGLQGLTLTSERNITDRQCRLAGILSNTRSA